MQRIKGTSGFVCSLICLCFLVLPAFAQQENEVFTLTPEALQDEKQVELNKLTWKYKNGDDLAWANPQFDDSDWRQIESTQLTSDVLSTSDWKGRAWFRLRVRVDERLADKNLAFITRQFGASEIYVDGERIVQFGEISDSDVSEYNPNRLPIPFRFESAGEHLITVRFASKTFADFNSSTSRWLTNGKILPQFFLSVREAHDLNEVIRTYKNSASMRLGFLLIGVLSALALLHFLLYVFYPLERANLFYSIYAAAFTGLLICGNLRSFGHQSARTNAFVGSVSSVCLGVLFLALLAFLHVAFGRKPGKPFWALAALWMVVFAISIAFLGSPGYLWFVAFFAIGSSFAFCIMLLVKALGEKRSGAWILMVGVQIFALSMLFFLLLQFGWIKIPQEVSFFAEFAQILAVPLAVSIFLARNFARTNRDLTIQLRQVEDLSRQKIEQERREAELRAENERRAKELEEARQLQLSLLPKKLPQLSNLEIAAYMKPATEVGGDYYDFHVCANETLTMAVGDATGHGLKAGTMVTATKSLFNNLSAEPVLPDILKTASAALKKMNLRGMFMALTMARISGRRLLICQAGMPPALLFRRETGEVEEFSSRAVPLGAPLARQNYQQEEAVLNAGDCLVIMSDGFPEMFNPAGEMIGFEKSAEILRESAGKTSAEIVERFVAAGEMWAASRPADDDVTFVVVKVSETMK